MIEFDVDDGVLETYYAGVGVGGHPPLRVIRIYSYINGAIREIIVTRLLFIYKSV